MSDKTPGLLAFTGNPLCRFRLSAFLRRRTSFRRSGHRSGSAAGAIARAAHSLQVRGEYTGASTLNKAATRNFSQRHNALRQSLLRTSTRSHFRECPENLLPWNRARACRPHPSANAESKRILQQPRPDHHVPMLKRVPRCHRAWSAGATGTTTHASSMPLPRPMATADVFPDNSARIRNSAVSAQPFQTLSPASAG